MIDMMIGRSGGTLGQMLATLLLAAACGKGQAPPSVPPASVQPAPTSAPAGAAYKASFKVTPPDQWTPIHGNWWVEHGVYKQDDASLAGARTMLSLVDSDCYTFAAAVRSVAGAGRFMFPFKYQGKYVWWAMGSSTGHSQVAGIAAPNETRRPFSARYRQLYKVKLIVNRDRVTAWLDDAQLWSIRRQPDEVLGLDPNDKSSGKDLVGLVGLGTWATSAEFTDVEVMPVCK